jgi:hypothetical protein
MEDFYVLNVDTNETGGDTWTNWQPLAVVTAETGARAIEQLAEDPGKVGEALVIAVPVASIVARQTTLHRHATVHEQAADLTALAPELREPAEEAVE